MTQVFTTYFRTLFQSSQLSRLNTDQCTQVVESKVTTELNITLLEPFTTQEVMLALKQMAHLKSHGPNGYNERFYQAYCQQREVRYVTQSLTFSMVRLLFLQIKAIMGDWQELSSLLALYEGASGQS